MMCELVPLKKNYPEKSRMEGFSPSVNKDTRNANALNKKKSRTA